MNMHASQTDMIGAEWNGADGILRLRRMAVCGEHSGKPSVSIKKGGGIFFFFY